MEQESQSHSMPPGAKNFFLYFLMFVLLYVVAINLGGLLFDIIDKLLPEVTEFDVSRFRQDSLRFHISALIIATPVFLYLVMRINKEARENSAFKLSGIRRWLTYITLLVTSLTVIGDLIALVQNLLGGERSLRFSLKALAVLLIAGSILYYYSKDIKALKTGMSNAIMQKIFLTITAIAVLGFVIGGIFMIETPAEQRARKQDVVRIDNLMQIDYGIRNHFSVNEALPASIDELTLAIGITEDPITQTAYEYYIIGDTTYELCATFETTNRDSEGRRSFDTQWLHDAGRFCFKNNTINIFTKGDLKQIPAEPPL